MSRFLVSCLSIAAVSVFANLAQAGEFSGEGSLTITSSEGVFQLRPPPRRPPPRRSPPRRPPPRVRPGWNCIAENRYREEFAGYDYYNQRVAQIEALDTCDAYSGPRQCRVRECFYVR